MKEEEEERTEDRGEEGERVNLKTEKSEARDSTEERRKTEGEGGDSKEVEEENGEGVKAEPTGKVPPLDANNDSKPLHLDSGLLVKAEVNPAFCCSLKDKYFQRSFLHG